MKIEELIAAERFIATEEVLRELQRKDDEVYRWARKRKPLAIPLDEEIQTVVAEILAKHPRLVGQLKERSTADPFVIALAEIRKCIVLTQEQRSPTPRRPRIPDVCEARGVKCVGVLDLIRLEKWRI